MNERYPILVEGLVPSGSRSSIPQFSLPRQRRSAALPHSMIMKKIAEL